MINLLFHYTLGMKRISYLVNFIVLGLLFPNNYIGALILGISWEVFKECIEQETISQDLLIQHFQDYKEPLSKQKTIDLVVMMVGYYLGTRLRGILIL